MKRILIKISLVFVVGLTSCGGYNSIVKSTDNNLKYDKALEYYYLYLGIETDDKMLRVVNQKIKESRKISENFLAEALKQ
jgi:carbonic anhydrase